jgi:hypothetical protein
MINEKEELLSDFLGIGTVPVWYGDTYVRYGKIPVPLAILMQKIMTVRISTVRPRILPYRIRAVRPYTVDTVKLSITSKMPHLSVPFCPRTGQVTL